MQAARLRADARRNRDQIIAAAQEIFVDEGLDVPMEAIARKAGVGVGTLYRRFPDRGELVAAVAAETFRSVLSDVTEAVAAEPAAWDVIVRLVTRSDSLRLTVHLAFLSLESWEAVHAAPESRDVHRAMMTALDQVIRDAQREGSVRADIVSGDALSLVSLVIGARPPTSDPVGRAAAERSLWLVLDGLRAAPRAPLPLPGAPVTMRDLDQRIEQGGDPAAD